MYSPGQLKFARVIVLILWVFAAGSFFWPLFYTAAGSFGRTLFGILIAVHLVEFPLFAKSYRRVGTSLWAHFPRHMAYGIVHRAEVENQLRGG